METDILITGFASITSAGPSRGLPPDGAFRPQPITRWTPAEPRSAVMVPAFRAADVVPGLRTRRMDRLSVWALVGAALALQDAELAVDSLDGERTAIACGTELGCIGLTGEFLGSLAANAAKADPVVFPETLSNLAASHVAAQLKIRGPNLTIAAGPASGEAALLTAVSLLNAGEADRALVLAGDTLTRAVYEWYEAAARLAPACTSATSDGTTLRPGGTLIPAEGLGACLLETRDSAAARRRRAYARFHGGWLGPVADGAAAADGVLHHMLGAATADEILIVESPGSRAYWLASVIERQDRDRACRPPRLRPGPPADFGDFGGAGLLRTGLACARLPDSPGALVLVADHARRGTQTAAILLAAEPRP